MACMYVAVKEILKVMYILITRNVMFCNPVFVILENTNTVTRN